MWLSKNIRKILGVARERSELISDLTCLMSADFHS